MFLWASITFLHQEFHNYVLDIPFWISSKANACLWYFQYITPQIIPPRKILNESVVHNIHIILTLWVDVGKFDGPIWNPQQCKKILNMPLWFHFEKYLWYSSNSECTNHHYDVPMKSPLLTSHGRFESYFKMCNSNVLPHVGQYTKF